MKILMRQSKRALVILLVSSMLVCEIPTVFVYGAEESLAVENQEPFEETAEDFLQVLVPENDEEEPIIVA